MTWKSLGFRLTAFLCIAFFALSLHAQQSERSVYRFLQLPSSPRTTALGYGLSSTLNPDVDMMLQNPALLIESMHQSWSASYENRLGGIRRSNLSGAYFLATMKATVGVSLAYLDYGTIDRIDPFGNQQGDFRPYEFHLSTHYSQDMGHKLHLGAGLHYIQARYAGNFNNALALNGGLYYRNEEARNSFGLTFGHTGFQVQQVSTQAEPLPFEIRATYSQRLQYLPFEWHLGLRHLNQPELLLPSENSSDVALIQQLGRHLVFGGELSIGKALQVRFSYDPWRNQNLSGGQDFDFSGTNYGFGIKLKQFDINIARSVQGDLGPQWQLGLLGHL